MVAEGKLEADVVQSDEGVWSSECATATLQGLRLKEQWL